MHSYIFKKVEADEDINVQASHNWLNTGLSSHVEGYITALQEQEIENQMDYQEMYKRLKDQLTSQVMWKTRGNNTPCIRKLLCIVIEPIHLSEK